LSKKIFRYIALAIVPFFAFLLIRFLYFTNRKKFHIPESIGNDPIIFACWHGKLLMLPYLYKHYRKKAHAKVLISDHFDGLLISKTVEYFGLDTIAGSSHRNPARVLIQGLKAIKDGYDIGITPDGPKGPMHTVSNGIIAMSQKTNTKIVLFDIHPSSYWEMKSWDKFIIPKPFGTLHYYASEPIDISKIGFEDARKFIKKGLLKYEK
jgi:lysophospholipid acyltransferase (LPLAT)-like uncharacterized protein